MRTLLGSLVVLLSTACVPGIGPSRTDDPDNPPDSSIEGEVTVADADTTRVGGRYYTNDPTLRLRILFGGAATKASVSVNGVQLNGFSTDTEHDVPLQLSEQFHTVSVTFRDSADHQGATVRLDVELDTEAPVISTDSYLLTDHRPDRGTDGLCSTQTSSEPVVDFVVDAQDSSSTFLRLFVADVFDTDGDGTVNCDSVSIDPTESGKLFLGAERTVLSANEGLHAICVQLADAAGNRTEVEKIGEIILDAEAPTSPRISTAGAIVDAAAYPIELTQSSDTGSGLAGYMVTGGCGEQGGSLLGTGDFGCDQFTNGAFEFSFCETCTEPTGAGDTIEVSFVLRQSFSNQDPAQVENILRVRAIDCAGNTSDDDFRFIVEDSRTPGAPQNVRAIEEDGAVMLRWNPPGDLDRDVSGYRIYYGTVSQDFAGTFATGGPSPIDVGNVQNYRLTGLPNGTAVYVSMTALDDTAWVEPSSSAPPCDSSMCDGLTPVVHAGACLCPTAHESTFSEEIAVLANPITPEPLPTDTLSSGWVRLSVPPDQTRLFVSAGSALYPFHTDFVTNGDGTLAVQSNVDKAFWDQLTPAEQENPQLQDYGYAISSEVLAPYDHFCAAGSAANCSPYLDLDCNPDLDPGCNPRVNENCLARCKPGLPVISDGFAGGAAFSSQKDLAYVANGSAGVLIVSNPTDGYARLVGTLGNPANFSRHVAVLPNPDDGMEFLAVGGERGVQLYALGSLDPESTTSHTSPSFVRTVLTHRSVRGMVWDPKYQVLFVSVYPDGIAVLDADLEFVDLGGGDNPFCPAAFTRAGEPGCDIIDLERLAYPAASNDSEASEREMLILADSFFGVAFVDVTDLGNAATGQLGFCPTDACMTQIRPGTLRSIEVYPPYLLALGSNRPSFARTGEPAGQDQPDRYWAEGAVIEVIEAQNRSQPFEGVGTLFAPESEADPAIPGEGWQLLTAGADMRVLRAPGGEATAVVAQRNLGLKAYSLADLPDLSTGVDLTPAVPGQCVRPAKVVGDARSLAVTGSRLLVGDGEAGLQVLSLKDPTRPRHELEQELGPTCTLTAPTHRARALDVAVTGPFAFVATSGAGVRLVDLRPIVGTSTQILMPANATRVSDFSAQIGLSARDLDGQITDQDLPSGDSVDPYPSASVVRVAARRDRLWFVGFDSGTVESSVGPGDLARLRLKLFGWDTSPLYDRALPLEGSYDGEPTAWDRTAFEEHRVDFEHLVAFPLDASTSDFTNVDDLFTNLEVNGDFLYLGIGYQEECPRTQGCGNTAFGGIIRVRADPDDWIGGGAPSDELDPFSSELGFFTYPSALPRQIQVRGQFIFVADEYRGLVLLGEDTGELMATLEPAGQARSLAVEGNLVYLGTTEGLQIVAVDTQDESATLSTVGFVKSPAPVLDVLVEGGLAYLAAGEAGLRVVDLADVSRPAPFPVAPFTDDDGSPAGEFSVSGTVAFLVSEGLDFFQRFDNKLLILDLDSPEEPLQAASTRIAAIGATHVHVDGGSVYVSLLRPVASGAVDPYERLVPSTSNNDAWQRAAPISAGHYAGAIAAGDSDWYLIRPDGIGSEDFFTLEVLVPDGIGDLESAAFIEADCAVDPTQTEPEEVFSANDGPKPFFVNNNAGGTDVCVYLRVQSFADDALEYAVQVGWDTVETCTDLTGDTLDAYSFECDSADDVPPGIAGASSATYHLCGPDEGTSEFYVLAVPAEKEAFVSVSHDSSLQNLDLYASSAGGACPMIVDQSVTGTNNVHTVVLENPGSEPAAFLLEVRHMSGTGNSPYVLQVHIGSEVEEDAFGNEDGNSRAVVAGRYRNLFLPGSGFDRFHIQAEAANGEGLCFSVREAAEGPVTGFLNNEDLTVRDSSGKTVTPTIAPGLVPPAGERCLEIPREDYAGVSASCDENSFCEGRIELAVTNPNEFPVSYVLDVGYREETGGLTDSAEPNDTIAEAEGSEPFAQHARLVPGPAFVSPLFIAAGERDYYPIALEADKWLSVLAERDASSANEMTVELVDSEDRLVAAPLYRSAHATALGYVARTSGTFYLRVRSDGDETGFGDYYFLEIEISDGDAVKAEVGSFNLTPTGLTSVAHSDMRPALSDAMAAWGPYAYHLTFNGTSRLTVTRFSETSIGAGGLIMPVREDLLFSEPTPTPPFTMVAEGPRIFVAEIESSLLWYVDVSPVLAGAAEPALIRGPWRLFPEEAPGVSGILLHGPTLFVSNAARGLIVALDTSELVTQASGASSAPGAWAERELGTGDLLPSLQPLIDQAMDEPVVGVSASTNVAGALTLTGSSLVSGLVGVSQDGPRSVGTAIFDVSDVLALAPDPFPVTELQTFSPVGAATVGAIHAAVAGPYLYVSNENGFQVLDLR